MRTYSHASEIITICGLIKLTHIFYLQNNTKPMQIFSIEFEYFKHNELKGKIYITTLLIYFYCINFDTRTEFTKVGFYFIQLERILRILG